MNNITKVNFFKKKFLITRKQLMNQYLITDIEKKLIYQTRINVSNILKGKDKRLLVIIGPCSIHDTEAALEYSNKLLELRKKYASRLEIIMRTYLEKPRTVIGWKGLISDPFLDGSLQINEGLKISRKLLLKINNLGVPVATEFLDTSISHFISDLISWGAIGARTTESQIHREMVSSLSCPVGFKNGTDGNVLIAIDAIRASNLSHMFLNPDENGYMNINYTSGNPNLHIILRGGKNPNYFEKDVKSAINQLQCFNLPSSLMIDFSHANCSKKYQQQLHVSESVSKQIQDGSHYIFGVMIESFLNEGSQNISNIKNLKYGVSITDACLNWDDSVYILKNLSKSVNVRF
ncbi:3-deoxy-7-phosphoheptulonate synthase [Buchnera aphidicola]|uniref:Phospho-2-dehydro-3-deoxyheptonate aldolase n=1 Tax=Buchnera aphidicola subsp. Tuberolachnus salignus TaxID=98804 RepID=A0A160SX61_BUCTT|nr:3-deoxy-7-phosphoheptulonate synthase [Buchnera aphidicola]CUR53065.1 Phospho-2-dehydro-3-deoxyheptonate aldolase,Trp-sensitive [Buchnera aphidicola (Tuberolachnus salignus)]